MRFRFWRDAPLLSCSIVYKSAYAVMSLLFFVPFLAGLLCLPSKLNIVSGCNLVARNNSVNVRNCLSYKEINVAGRRVPLGKSDMRIQLEEPTRDVSLICGRHSGVYSWKYAKKNGNQIRVSFLEGYLHLEVYWCDSFGDDPERAGIRCAIEAFSTACPGRVGNNHTCVYEVETKRFSSDTVRKAVQVTDKVVLQVLDKAQLSAGVSHTKEHTVVNTYSVNRRSYIVIPAGYRFCSFSTVTSKKDPRRATGFKWSCNLPTFYQINRISGRCTDLALCESKSPCAASDNQPSGTGSGAKSAVAQPVAMLLALCIIVSGKLANCVAL
jgi:hypothetical protein